MEIDRIAATKIQVRLSVDDMKTLNMHYPDISWEDERVRANIQSILDRVKTETGFSRRGEKLLIEAFEPHKGECCFLFTLLPRTSGRPHKRRYRVVRPGGPLLYRFDGAEELLDAMHAVAYRGVRRHSSSKLFRHGGQYHLLVYPAVKMDRRVESVLLEFGEKRPCHTYEAARLEEYGTLIADGDVIKRMAGSFGSLTRPRG